MKRNEQRAQTNTHTERERERERERGRKQNLKFLKRSVYILKDDISNNRENFMNDTRNTDFGKFYNEQIEQIDLSLLELKHRLKIFEANLSSKIRKMDLEKEEMGQEDFD